MSTFSTVLARDARLLGASRLQRRALRRGCPVQCAAATQKKSVGETMAAMKAKQKYVSLLFFPFCNSRVAAKGHTAPLDTRRHNCAACRVAFIPFLCAGDPDLDTTAKALLKLDEIGADVMELGVPYSVSGWCTRLGPTSPGLLCW